MRHAHRSIRHCQTVGDARHPSTTCQVRTHLPRSAAHCRSDDPALITGARDSRSCQESSEVSVIRTWTTRPSLGVGVPACQPGVPPGGRSAGSWPAGSRPPSWAQAIAVLARAQQDAVSPAASEVGRPGPGRSSVARVAAAVRTARPPCWSSGTAGPAAPSRPLSRTPASVPPACPKFP